MSAVLRIGLLLCAVQLAACESILGIHDLASDEPLDEPYRLSFVSIPSKAFVQRPFGDIRVVVEDRLGRPTGSNGSEIRLMLASNPGGASLLGSVAAKVVLDTAYFDDIFVEKVGSYTLVASAEGLMPATSAIAVVVPPFTRLSTGLDGGPIATVAVSPAPPGGMATAYAATGHGVYTSRDGGATWTPPGRGGDIAQGLVVADPRNPGVAYLVSRAQQSYLFMKTEDGGASWRTLRSGSSRARIMSIAIDAKNPSTVYAADLSFSDGSTSRLYRTSDGGVSWSTSGLPQGCLTIAIDPGATSNLYCARFEDGVHRSTDAGASWVPASTGISSTFVQWIVATPEALFAATGNGLYRSTNAAASWTPLSVPTVGRGDALAYAPSMPRRIYAVQNGNRLFVSSDAGASFGPEILVPASVSGLAVGATNPDLVYIATSVGVFVSSNAGATWSSSSKGIDASQILSMAHFPGTTGTLMASTPGAVIRSTSGGATWTTVAQQTETRIAFDPVMPTTAYLCGNRSFATSTNSGASFGASTDLGIACNQLALAGATLFAAGSARLRKSTNRGASWADISVDGHSVQHVVLGDGTGNVVVAGSNGGIFRSVNGGTSFTQVAATWPGVLLADPKAPARIFAIPSGSCGLLVSRDGGATFDPRSTLCPHALGAAGSVLYAASSDSLFSSPDGGENWTPVELTGGVPRGLTITSIAASDDGKAIYLGTSAGVYKSTGP